jgi:hypothetical protein
MIQKVNLNVKQLIFQSKLLSLKPMKYVLRNWTMNLDVKHLKTTPSDEFFFHESKLP